MNETISTLLLALVEGVTEFLPVSSTGHLLIAEKLGLGSRSELFNIGIQGGAIIAVTVIYWKRIWQLLSNPTAPTSKIYLARLALAFGLTVVGGLLIKKLGLGLPEAIAPVAMALIVGGVIILGVEWHARRPQPEPLKADPLHADPEASPPAPALSWRGAAAVGLAQVLAAVFPGTSRSAASIFAAMLAGPATRPAATEFSFLVGIPTMYAATAYALLKAHSSGALAHEDWTQFAIGFVASGVTAFAVVVWLLRYIQTHTFTVFAWYRIIAGVLLLIFY